MKRILSILLVFWFFTFPFAEVSVGPGTGSVSRVSLVNEGGTGAGEPWPSLMSWITADYKLNVNGSSGQHKDGAPSVGWDGSTPEVVFAHWDGNDYEIVCARWNGSAWGSFTNITSNSADDVDPVIRYTTSGAEVYWMQGTQIYKSTRSAGTWSSPTQVSTGYWTGPTAQRVVYASSALGTHFIYVAVRKPVDGTADVTQVGSTAFTDPDPRLSYSGGTVWATWQQSSTSLGYSILQANGTWSSASYHAITGADDEEAGRERVQALVLQ